MARAVPGDGEGGASAVAVMARAVAVMARAHTAGTAVQRRSISFPNIITGIGGTTLASGALALKWGTRARCKAEQER
jgi:hypothetical protein